MINMYNQLFEIVKTRYLQTKIPIIERQQKTTQIMTGICHRNLNINPTYFCPMAKPTTETCLEEIIGTPRKSLIRTTVENSNKSDIHTEQLYSSLYMKDTPNSFQINLYSTSILVGKI